MSKFFTMTFARVYPLYIAKVERKGRTVEELVQAAFAAAGIPELVEASIRVDPAFVRPPELIAPIGDASRAERELGWKRQISFEQMIAEMVETDLAELRSAS